MRYCLLQEILTILGINSFDASSLLLKVFLLLLFSSFIIFYAYFIDLFYPNFRIELNLYQNHHLRRQIVPKLISRELCHFSKYRILHTLLYLLSVLTSHLFYTSLYSSSFIGINDYKRHIFDNLEFVSNKKSVSMHFRIGDYKKVPNHHPILEIGYYPKSLEFISKTINGINSFVSKF